ncbi:MAG TPA: hypothetical protein VN373_01390, partial [Methanosarcina barkeri]|nr:hypothetical protein [Methanosarcina barkeri]
ISNFSSIVSRKYQENNEIFDITPQQPAHYYVQPDSSFAHIGVSLQTIGLKRYTKKETFSC